MPKHDRWSSLLEVLAAEGRLDVEDAAGRLGVSAATIRRDFDELSERRMLLRTRGGALAHGVSYELPLRYRSSRNARQKQQIAAAAADLIGDGEVVGLNGGTTTTEVARALAVRAGSDLQAVPASGEPPVLTVVTNALNIAGELAVRPQIKIVTTGGVARPQTYELVGPLTRGVLDEVVLDVVVLGADAVDPGLGVMTRHEDEASVSRQFAERARRVIVVADSTKMGARAFARICGIARIDVLVTDSAVEPAMVAGLTEAGIKVLAV
ncbi:Glucitol operon repressor [Streptomyces sp. YIM 130001]|uniref:DeoR/GlpR family DNA-binding transcription regulator n=1 Tax=Streptomyces sp. YIM 130001 TaxID=2259644 RepID=UPI000E65497B|nr:DeoR/GlpR family DNA-binding transcription regulator [Streptomyces sp. YIM 130001]RII17703.1 Glucitol operon repressor [Streptomyces sp. YIM 130001]